MSDGPNLLDKWRMLGAVMADRRLTPAARHVAWALLNDHGPRGCYPGIDRLRAYTGLSRTAVQGAIAKLESCGWFVRDAGLGRGNSSRYHWQWEKGQQAYTLLMDGLSDEKAKLRDQKGQHSFTEKANTAWPESGKEPCTDTGRARARAEAAAGEGEGFGEKASTSPASVPAGTPDARQGSRGRKQQRANGSTDPDQVRSDLVTKLAQEGEYLTTYGTGASEVADQDLARMEDALGRRKAHERLRAMLARGMLGYALRQAVERVGDHEGVAG
jgi:DNA-binding MarR family transcriptional regulator